MIIGIKAGCERDAGYGRRDKIHGLSECSADVEVADKTELYVNAGGKMYSNSMYEMSRVDSSHPMAELLPRAIGWTLSWVSGAAWHRAFG